MRIINYGLTLTEEENRVGRSLTLVCVRALKLVSNRIFTSSVMSSIRLISVLTGAVWSTHHSNTRSISAIPIFIPVSISERLQYTNDGNRKPSSFANDCKGINTSLTVNFCSEETDHDDDDGDGDGDGDGATGSCNGVGCSTWKAWCSIVSVGKGNSGITTDSR